VLSSGLFPFFLAVDIGRNLDPSLTLDLANRCRKKIYSPLSIQSVGGGSRKRAQRAADKLCKEICT
jgi:hypothetical protein